MPQLQKINSLENGLVKSPTLETLALRQTGVFESKAPLRLAGADEQIARAISA
jgi:hypothetical protein